MKRIAIVSDAHSNIPATTAVFKHIEKNNIDYIYSIGDMIGKGPSPAEVVSIHQDYCNICILGNWEDFLLHSGVFENPIHYYRNKLSDNQVGFLRSLGYSIEFYMSGRLIRVFHAHPNSVYQRVFRKALLESHMEMFLPPTVYDSHFPDKMADVVIYGDIHYPYHVKFDGDYIRKHYESLNNSAYKQYEEFESKKQNLLSLLEGREIYNTGSIGQPFGSTLASYIVVEGFLDSKLNSDFNIEFVKVPYDNVLASQIALRSSMFDKHEYSKEILTGNFRGYSPGSKITKLL